MTLSYLLYDTLKRVNKGIESSLNHHDHLMTALGLSRPKREDSHALYERVGARCFVMPLRDPADRLKTAFSFSLGHHGGQTPGPLCASRCIPRRRSPQ